MIDIVLCTDDNYVMPTGVLIYSIEKTNTEDSFYYHVVTSFLTESSKRALSRAISNASKIEFLTIDKTCLSKCPVRPGEHVSIATYFRLLLPSVMPHVSKVLYLDGDILCVGNISALWNINLDGFSAAAATDMRCLDSEIISRLSLPENTKYLNAGVMLINLDWWREHDVQNKALTYIAKNAKRCVFHDQDALNVVLQGSMKIMSVRFNFQERFFGNLKALPIGQNEKDDVIRSKDNICLVHFTGKKKPWHYECVNPLKNAWRHALKNSLWKQEKLCFKYSGMKRVRFLGRKLLEKLHILKSKNPYQNFMAKEILHRLAGIL